MFFRCKLQEYSAEGRERKSRANEIASQIVDGRMIYYMNINDNFLTEDGILSPDIMPDLYHPGPESYRIWAEAIDLKLASLLGES